MKKIITIAFLINAIAIFSQSLPLYKLAMKSDIILITESSNFETIENKISEFSTQRFIKILKIDNELKNRFNDKILGVNFKNFQENEDYFSSVNGEYCTGVGFITEPNYKSYNIFFIKKNKNKYNIISQLWSNITEKNLLFFTENIRKLNEIEKIKNMSEKYEKTVDWYLSLNNLNTKFTVDNIFTEEFVNYYKSKKIIQDNILLNSKQKAKAKELFLLNGNFELLDYIQPDYQKEIREYFISKLHEIKNKLNKEWADYYQFQTIVSYMDSKNMKAEIKYINELLTSDVDDSKKEEAIDIIIEQLN